MGVLVGFLLVLSSLTLVRAALVQPIFNVVNFGAVGNGRTDNTKAFLRAWNATCADAHPKPLFFVPSPGTFLLRGHIIFSGPCRSKNIKFQVAGNIVAPRGLWTSDVSNSWISFRYITGLSIFGSGMFDGQGSDWWACKTNRRCSIVPYSVSAAFCDRFRVSGLTFANSPSKHLTVYASRWVVIDGIKVLSPGDSPNTDGLYLQQVKHVKVTSSIFSTGDDCVAIGTGTSDVNISQITCGPGHGISIGSLGRDGSRAEVENIRVSSSNISNTLCGVRIKTWPGGTGFAREITFENINFRSVHYPIIIDQYYCGGPAGCKNKRSAVQVSNVRYIGVSGTSAGEKAIRLECSNTVPCTGILLHNVVIRPDVGGMPTSSTCFNVRGRTKDQVVPQVSCMT